MSLSRPRREREEEGGGGDEGQRESTPGKRRRRCSCCQETKDFYERQFEILKKEMQCMSKGFVKKQQREMQEFYQNSQLQLKEEIFKGVGQLIREQLNIFISELTTPGDKHLRNYSSLRVIPNQNQTRTYRLKFENKYCNDKYSRRGITADDDSPIKVAIYDHENRIITNGRLSSILVKIVVLDGEFNNENKEQWSRVSFCDSIVKSRPGKLPLFSSPNGHYLRLENGVATLRGAKFQDNSSFRPSKKFRMGVMADDDSISEEVMEGISEPFSVKDGRGYRDKKDHHPSLSDPIYKLKKIGKNGDRRKLLEQMQIKLVQDFVRFYNKDKGGLRKDCKKIPDHDWDTIVKHALSYKPQHECYSYRIPDMDITIFFDSVYSIVGAKFSGKYSSYNELDDEQKDLVEASKMKAWDNLTVVQHKDKKNCYGYEVTDEDKGCNYLRGSCSNLSVPALPTNFHDEIPQHGTGLESGPEQESRPPRQRWMKIRANIGIILWNEKPSTESSLGSTDTFANMGVLTGSEVYAAPFTEDGLGMTDSFHLSQVVAETGCDLDLSDFRVEDISMLWPGYM